MPKFVKGSQEAKEHMANIRQKRKVNPNPKPPNPNKGIRKRNENTKVDIPMMSSQSIAIPEFYATKNISKKTGKVSYRLVNPLTHSRNLSRRKGEPSLKLIRKPIENMIIMENSTEHIPLSMFGKKDRETIDTHFKVVETHKGKEVVDVPKAQPFRNKERGRPEKLPKNIMINKQRKKGKKETIKPVEEIQNEIIDHTSPVKTKRTYTKHQSEEERLEAKRKQKRDYATKRRAKLKALKGEGILDNIKSFGKKVVNTAKNVSKKVEDTAKSVGKKVEQYANVVINGRNDYPPKVRNILSKYGDNTITSMVIGRTPVPSILTSALSVASGGVFGKNLKNSPYDTLFHLFLRCELDDGTIVSLEKNEVINSDIDPPIPPNTQTEPIQNIPQGLSLNTILDNAKKIQGGKFFNYSARDNNCQDFILAILNGSNIGNQQDREFVKQDTKSLFGNMTGLRKLSNSITDLGAKVNEITTGAGLTDKVISHFKKDNKEMKRLSNALKTHLKTEKMTGGNITLDIDSDYSDDGDKEDDRNQDGEVEGGGIGSVVQSVIFHKDKHNIKDAKKWLREHNYKHPKIDDTDNTYRFRQINPSTIEKKGYTIYKNKPLGDSGIILVIAYKKKNNISTNNIMPKFAKGSKEAKEHMAKIRAMKGGSIKNDIRPVAIMNNVRPMPMVMPLTHTGTSSVDEVNKNSMRGEGLYAGGSSGGSLGLGVHHHHHYIDAGDDSDSDTEQHIVHIKGGKLSKIGQAFNKAFNPQKNGVAAAVNKTIVQPIQNDANKVVSGFNSTFNPALGRQIENGAKVVGHYTIPALTSALGGAAGTTLGLLSGPVGGFAGGVAGSALGAYGGQQIDRALGIQNNTSFDGRGFKKGSKEAKAHMAKIRAMKGKGVIKEYPDHLKGKGIMGYA